MKQLLQWSLILFLFLTSNVEKADAQSNVGTVKLSPMATPAPVQLPASAATIVPIAGLLESNSAAPERVNWLQTVQETSAHNSEVISARENYLSLQDATKGSYSDFFPQVSGSLGYTYANTLNTGTAGSSISIPTQTNYSATFNASENIFTGLLDEGKINQAKANEKNAAAAMDFTRAKVTYDLKTAYAALMYAQRSIALQESIVSRRSQNLQLVQLRFESGRENKGSVMLSQADFNQARYAELQARDNLVVARSQLARVLGRDEDSNFELSEDVPLVLPVTSVLDFKQITVDTPTHVQSVAQENAAEAGVTIARSGFFPTLGFNGSLGNQGPTWFPQGERWSIGLSLTLPIFNGGRDFYGTKAAIATYSASTATRFNGDRVILFTLKQNYTNFIEAIEKLKVDQSYAQAASVRSEIARNQYNNGLLTFDDWTIIENDLITRQGNVLLSEQALTTAEAAWQQTQGKGVIP
jgi:outer membrane protein